MHHNSTDLRAVLRDYSAEMILPALELYTHGLMADSTMYDAFVKQYEEATTPSDGEAHDNDVPAS
jgi:hypothetical protein